EVEVDEQAAHRIALLFLHDHRLLVPAVELDVEESVTFGQDRAQTASLDLERRRLVPLAVNDAGHVSRAAQAASGAGAALDARLDREGGSLAGHRGGILGTGARCCPTLGEMAEEPKDRSIPRG